jgi:hypothetical protein
MQAYNIQEYESLHKYAAYQSLVMWDFVMDKSGGGAGILPRTSVSPANLYSICFSTIIFTITRGWHNRPEVAAVPIASQTK